jgi:hypothetical protein
MLAESTGFGLRESEAELLAICKSKVDSMGVKQGSSAIGGERQHWAETRWKDLPDRDRPCRTNKRLPHAAWK